MFSPYFDEAIIPYMDKYQCQGDLADMLMPRNRVVSPDEDIQRAATSLEDHSSIKWRLPLPHEEGDRGYDFGDPFSFTKDPLLHELELMSSNGSSFFGRSISEDSAIYPIEEKAGDFGDCVQAFPRDIAFTNTICVSSSQSQSPQQGLPVSFSIVPSGSLEKPITYSEAISSNSMLRLIDTATAMQISAVQNSSMNRRKGQAKKVVCIPAPPAVVNGRAGGEVVPSDLWAWRKYGQKPIKGSPYPRGYYRCSSSKGCSARKQVERSRMDPKMLVITYTSEHNHPWPTQRNALAGSTRATQSANKNNTSNNVLTKISSSSSSPSKNQQQGDKRPNDVVSRSKAVAGGSSGAYIKEELEVTNSEALEEDFMTGSVPGKCEDEDDDNDFLFQDLEAMAGDRDPLSFLLNQGVKQKCNTVDSDSFGNFFDWSD